jgi:hypothetical protein
MSPAPCRKGARLAGKPSRQVGILGNQKGTRPWVDRDLDPFALTSLLKEAAGHGPVGYGGGLVQGTSESADIEDGDHPCLQTKPFLADAVLSYFFFLCFDSIFYLFTVSIK